MPEPVKHARIITDRLAGHPNLAGFETNDRLKFELYKLAIEEVYLLFKGDRDGSVELDSITIDDLRDYKQALSEIERGFYAFYENHTIRTKGNTLEPDFIQPLIDAPGTKLFAAISAKAKGNEEECLNKLKECRLKLFHLVEYIKAIKLENDKPPP